MCAEGESDHLYVQRWQIAVFRCKKSLERHDLRQVEDIQDPASSLREIRKLERDYPNNAATSELIMLTPSFAQLEVFSGHFVIALDDKVDTAIFWGILLLSLKVYTYLVAGSLTRLLTVSQLAIRSENALFRIARMLKVLGHKAELFNGYSKHATSISQMKEVALDVHIELITFLTEIVKFFRGDMLGT